MKVSPLAGLFGAVVSGLMPRSRLDGLPRPIASSWLAFAVSVAIVTLYNATFWHHLFARTEHIGGRAAAFALALGALHVAVLMLPLCLANSRALLKATLIALLLVAATIFYFNGLGVVIDRDMLVNIAETDVREAWELGNPRQFWQLLVLGILPAVWVWRIPVNYPQTLRAYLKAFFPCALGFVGALTLVYANFQYAIYFGRENNDLKNYLNPTFTVVELVKFVKSRSRQDAAFTVLGEDATLAKASAQRRVGIFIIGETARADHFGFNGYPQPTTPYLDREDLINFGAVTSCGTSTAYSIPCVFSFLDGNDYSPTAARTRSNVLDVLQTAGVKTLWRDNNSSCKGVCARTEYVSFRDRAEPGSRFFHDGEYYDEVLLTDLDEVIEQSQQDLLIVLHPLGSHGPAYHRRYPSEFARFTPGCISDAPQLCTPEEVNNSYDNTILYTDYLIERAITYLRQHEDDFQSFLIYASDHGESLGESGIYLHGLPLAIAPQQQRQIPMLLWLSANNSDNTPANKKLLRACARAHLSHDVISSSLLSLFEVQTSLRDPGDDVLDQACTTRLAAAG